jgi:glyoxylase-like metal-dependent hydrolase (beta-lactamase superfamily II)
MSKSESDVSDKDQKEDTFDSPPEEPRPEDDYPEEEPRHPGWQSLAQIFNRPEPFFENILFMLAYDYTSNVYLLQGDYLTVVDAGNDYTVFIDLFQRGVKHADIKKIVLTHGHRDHCMGAFELVRAYPPIKEGGGLELIMHKDGPPGLKEVVKHFGSRVTEVQGGEILNLSGMDWEVIYTPGHTLDGICLYHAPSKTLITGDTVLPHAMGEADKGAGGQMSHYLFSMRTLLKRDIENVLPGHGAPVTGLGKMVVEQTYEGLMLHILGVKPESHIPWIAGAEALASQGLLEEALFCCNKALVSNPETPQALQIKALCLTDLGRGEEAIEVLDIILAKHAHNDQALTAKGHALLGLGKYQESLEYFDRALQINPSIHEAQVCKGLALYLSGQPEKAMEIDAFREEFIGRFKEELEKQSQAGEPGDPPDRP